MNEISSDEVITSIHILKELISQTYEERGGEISNNTTKEILLELSKDEDYYRRAYVAQNPNTPQEILEILSVDRNKLIRFMSIRQLDIKNFEKWQTFARDDCEEIRYYISGHINAPTEVLEELSKDSDHWVRANVAENIKTPTYVLKNLLNDDWIYCRSSALYHLTRRKGLGLFL